MPNLQQFEAVKAGEYVPFLTVALQPQIGPADTVRRRLGAVPCVVKYQCICRYALGSNHCRVLREIARSEQVRAGGEAKCGAQTVVSDISAQVGRKRACRPHAATYRCTSPSWLIFCFISILQPAMAPKPPTSPLWSSYFRASKAVSSVGTRTSAIIKWFFSPGAVCVPSKSF